MVTEKIIIKQYGKDVALDRLVVTVENGKAWINNHETIPKIATEETKNVLNTMIRNKSIKNVFAHSELNSHETVSKVCIETNEDKICVELYNIHSLINVSIMLIKIYESFLLVSGMNLTEYAISNSGLSLLNTGDTVNCLPIE